jgi:hypothetical protein
MRRLLALVLLLLPLPALASEDAYLAARDRYIAQFKPKPGAGEPDERTTKAEQRARADLEAQLRKIIGPSPVKGFPPQGSSNLQGLVEGELGFGQLDALTYATKDGKLRLVVTTPTLLSRWLARHKNWWKANNVPQDVNAALRSESFYTQAISSDASIARFAEIPVTKPASASTAYAMLSMSRQDIGPGVPEEIIVSVARPDRVFILSAAASTKITPIKACDAVWEASERKAKTLYDAYQASGLKDQKVFDQYTRTQEEGDAAFRRCFNERAKNEPFFAALTRQTQELVNRLQ